MLFKETVDFNDSHMEAEDTFSIAMADLREVGDPYFVYSSLHFCLLGE